MSEPLMCPVCGLSLPSVPLTLGANLNVQVCSSLCAWRWEHHAYTVPGEEWAAERDPRHGESTMWDEP